MTGPTGPAGRPAGAPPTSLVDRLAAGDERAALTFAGQGVAWLGELSALVADRPELRPLLDEATATLVDEAGSPEGLASGRYRHGFDVAAWVTDRGNVPDDAYLRSAAVSYPGILLAQLLLWQVVRTDGLERAGHGIVAAAGHSQGLLAALAVAEAPFGRVDDGRIDRHLRFAARLGRALAATAPGPATGPDGEPVSPMAAVRGVREDRLAALVAEVNDSSPERLAVSIALRNAGDRFVLSGPPEGLLLVRAALDRTAAAEEDQRRRGRRGGSPLRFGWSALDVEVPFHLAGASAEAAADAAAGELAAAGLLPSGADLAVAVVDPAGERDLRHEPDLAGTVVRSQFCNPVRWDATVRRLVEAGAGWVLDLGPGTDVAHLSTAAVRGSGARVLALASPEGRRVLATPGVAAREPDLRYADLAPGVVELPDGTRHLDNRHTRVAGRPPILLAGMTPTTADAGIVAAAANAGWHAELAGGGQPTTEALATRLEELDEQLAPGAEVVFNTLYLDRHLWDLHWERDGLILDARRQGSALRGLTVSAGIPDVDEAVAIARRLLDAGMPYVAFKPGTVDQIRQVGAIADALAPHPVFAQVEGGKAGGHHSWEDLDDLLLATYHDLRRRPNVVLCVGGGVAAPDRAADLLTGTWALAHGEPPMPVDGVLLGTVAMACAEATASPQVKAALVAAAGTADWVPRRGSGGGVTSGRSNLNADVHCLDNHAAQVAHLLEEVAGDPAAVAARADELVAALARTAKPYFGDLRAMTYLEVLERLVELMATGRHRRLDDGAWGDPTWRRRALEVFRRFAARLSPVDEGPVEVPVATPGDLDDPAAALAAFTRAHPRAATTLLHPADVDAVLASCDGPGKPVPFVPVLDGEIRRWYMADALWQAQDDRLDADAVLVIPGPEAVAGIERADEPVADLLARFEAAVLERLERAGTPVVPRDRLATTGLAPRHLARAVQGADGPVAGLLVASSVADEEGRSRPNPLWRWIDAGDRIESEVDEAGRLVALTARPWDRPAESVRVAADPDDEAVVVVASDAGDGDPPLRVRYRATAGPGGSGPTFSELDGPQARRDHTRAVLLGDDAASVGGTSLRARSWTCPPGWAGAYAATVGAPADTPLLGLAFSLAWPSLADLLLASPVADAFERVVHHELDVTPGPAWPPQPGEDGEVVATVVAARDEGSTQAVRCRAELRSARGRLAVVEATLRVLAPAGRLPWVEERRDRLRLALDAGDRAALDLLADQPWWHPVPGAATHDGSGTATAHGDDAGAGADRGAHGSEGAPSREGDAPDTTSDGGATADRGAVGTVEVDVSIGLTRAVPGGPARVTATGLARVAGQVVAEIRLDEVAEVRDHPVQAALDLVGRPAPERRPRPRRRTAGATDVAPVSLDGFAAVSGDRNPLHRSVLAARRAGRRGPVVHGMWTASRAEALVVDALCDGDPSRLARWAVTFTAPVEPGDEVEVHAERVGVLDGATLHEVVVQVDGAVVATATATVAPPPTALVFPGQGVQRPGLGSEGRRRSRAARAAWARADEVMSERFGIPLARIVEQNPTELRRPDGTVLRHPAGVLYRTEITQPALVALAAAQVAEMAEDGVLPAGFVAAGHSVGEFSALVALDVLPLEAAVELVHRRGEVMQDRVPRDADGSSPYRLAAVDPSVAGLDDAGLATVVAEVAAATGGLLEVVNHNAAGRQSAVAGTEATLDALAARLPGRGSLAAVRPLAGIDVPFHSSVLAPAVADLRPHLERLVPEVDPAALVGRWVPNLTGTPFGLDDASLDAASAATGASFAAARAAGPAVLARAMVVELLAHQLAAPVRWVSTQRTLAAPRSVGGLACRRLVEVGPATGPVLSGLARTTYAAEPPPGPPVELRHAEVDRDLVWATDEPPAVDGPGDGSDPLPVAPVGSTPAADAPRPATTDVATGTTAAGRGPGSPAAATAAGTGTTADADPADTGGGSAAASGRPAEGVPVGPGPAGEVPDVPVPAAEAFRMVLAAQARVRLDQLTDGETIEELFGGASSRRNQVLLDLGRELGLSGTEGVHEVPVGDLAATLAEAAPAYRFPGAYLRDLVAAGVTRALGGAGIDRATARAHLQGRWGFGPGLTDGALAWLALATRPGPSARGGELAEVPEATNPAEARTLLDRAAQAAAARVGVVAVPRQAATSAGAEAPVVSSRVTEALRRAVRALAEGLDEPAPLDPAGSGPDAPDDRLALLDAELGTDRAGQVAPAFDPRRAVRFCSGWATARWDLVEVAHAVLDGRADLDRLRAVADRAAAFAEDEVVAATARWLADLATGRGHDGAATILATAARPRRVALAVPATRPVTTLGPAGDVVVAEVPDPGRGEDLAARAGQAGLALAAGPDAPDRRDEVVLVTGAGPGSIAAEAVRHLLRAGATVVVATSSLTRARRRAWREVYAEVAGAGAELHLVPANLAAFADVDALVAWLADPAPPQRGRPDLRTGPLVPTLVLPFAATTTVGDLPDAGSSAEVAVRLQLLGVERLVGAVAELVGAHRRPPATVVLPLSPNHGDLGGDGPYAETKAGLEALLRRWHAEHGRWGRHVSLVGARIGWVRGTGLMGGNDVLAGPVEEQLGVRTFSAAEMGALVAACAGPEVRAAAADGPLELDLAGGLDRVADLRAALEAVGAPLQAGSAAARRAHELRAALAARTGRSHEVGRTVAALPSPPTVPAAELPRDLPAVPPDLRLEDLVVVVGGAELGPCGTATVRRDLERGGELGPAAVAELAWLCGLVRYQRQGYRGGWVDAASGEAVDEADLAGRYRDRVRGAVGLRTMVDDGVLDPAGFDVLVPVVLDEPLAHPAGSDELAEGHRAADPAHAEVRVDPATGERTVVHRPGAAVRVARRVGYPRRVVGQLPDGTDLGRFGVPGDLLTTADRMALVNLACTAEAFAEAGIEPAELLAAVHPAMVANTQGAGMGGMASLRRLLLDRMLDQERQNDRLQEALGNVVAAHVVQAYVGSYGSMIHPVAACATAAVSLEAAWDKIRAGKALAVVAGGYDDLTPEGVLGFADMHATADSDELEAMGIEPDESSRANDLRRRGFVESQGGGTLLVVRGDVARDLGLPVRAVLAYAASFGDGISSSIPAPGLGLLAAARGGKDSPLGRALAGLGLSADDVAVVSKHDTSTEANDPNEADLHHRIAEALGRSPGNPLLVVSQKTVTGHSKGGAAAWQVQGLLDVLETGVVPGNATLESVDPLIRPAAHLAFGHRPISLARGERVRAAVLTSLGFGHVNAMVVLAHPDLFLAALPVEQRADHVHRAAARRAEGVRRRLERRIGSAGSLRQADRAFADRDEEARFLLGDTT